MKECLQNMTQEEIQNDINNKLSSMIKDGYYISSVNSIGEITQCVDSTVTDIHYTITFEKIQKKRPKPILDKEEKKYLEAVIRPFRKKISYVLKDEMRIFDNYYNSIAIYLKSGEIISFPNFEKGTMYKGMKLNKEYTLEELGLFE